MGSYTRPWLEKSSAFYPRHVWSYKVLIALIYLAETIYWEIRGKRK